MNPLGYSLLVDENVHPEVVGHLRGLGFDVRTVNQEGLAGRGDGDILPRGYETGRVVVTHDSDFGRLAFVDRKAFTGIIYLRPGHIDSRFVIAMLDFVRAQPVDVHFPFLVVVERIEQTIRMRIRQR